MAVSHLLVVYRPVEYRWSWSWLDPGRSYREAGELVALSAKHGAPPRAGYAAHRYWCDDPEKYRQELVFVARMFAELTVPYPDWTARVLALKCPPEKLIRYPAVPFRDERGL